MKLMSARSKRAPKPPSSTKRLPASFTARSASIMPSSAPKSQCGFISMPSASKSRGVPQRRTSGLSFSSLPTGVESAGMFGVASSMLCSSSSAAARSAPNLAICSFISETSALAASASSFLPSPISLPIDLERALRFACSSSSLAIEARRDSSNSWKRAESHVWLRFFIAVATSSRCSRTNRMSSIAALSTCLIRLVSV